jgi:hypothetical protein
MAAKRKGKRADEPRLDDDSNWVTLTMTHHILSEQRIGARGPALATMELNEGLRCGELRWMRRSMVNPRRCQRGRAAFFRGRKIYLDDGIVRFYPPDQKTRRKHNTRVPWAYYVWKPDIDRLLSKPETKPEINEPETELEINETPLQKPGTKTIKKWRLHVAAELYRIVVTDGKLPPAAPYFADFCRDKLNYVPDMRAIQRLLKYLL